MAPQWSLGLHVSGSDVTMKPRGIAGLPANRAVSVHGLQHAERATSTGNVSRLSIRCQAANNNSNAATNPYLAIAKLRARAVQEAPGKQAGSEAMESRAERLMRMQMELLNQLEERRRLHAALLKSLDDPTSTIQSYNSSFEGGLPPVSVPAAPSSPLPTPLRRADPPQAASVAAAPTVEAPPAPVTPPAPSAAAASPLSSAPPSSPLPQAKPAAQQAASRPAAAPTEAARQAPAAAAPSTGMPRAGPATASAATAPAPPAAPATAAPTAPPPSSRPAAPPAPPVAAAAQKAPAPAPAAAAKAPASPLRLPARWEVSKAAPAAPQVQKAPAAPTQAAAAPAAPPSQRLPPAPAARPAAAPAKAAAAPPQVAPPAAKSAPAPPAAQPKAPPAQRAPATAAAAAAPPQAKPAPAPPSPLKVPKTAPAAQLPPLMPKVVEEKQVLQLVKDVEAAAPPEEKPAEPLAGPNVMNIVMVASECAPWSKTGGLGDVVGALPKALARRGHRVMVVVPRYAHYEGTVDMGVHKRYNVAGQDMEVRYQHAYIDGVDFVFLDHGIFNRGQDIYGGSREEIWKRMILLCKAAIECPWHVPCGGVCYGDGNLVFVANDWHTALLPVYLQAYYRDHGSMQFARAVLVIHNMAHQGRGPVAEYGLLGLPEHYLDRFKLYDPVGGEHMNMFMAGIISAHRIVAVSRGYAWEIQTQMGGWGLDKCLQFHNGKLRGIVNGIDTKEWSPAHDSFLDTDGYRRYDISNFVEGKAACKAALQRELGLPVRPEVPMLAFIGRLDHQKGVDIIGEAMDWLTQQDMQLVLLGTGRHDLEDMLRGFEGRHKDKVRAWVGFSVKMAHRFTAAADILLMPSRFEPCGLNQLYAFSYGTVPVVHAVGGLRDTVIPFDPFNNTGLGWTFESAQAQGLIHAAGNAMYTFREFKESWRAIQIRGMSQDLSWDNAAAQYEEILVEAKYVW